MFNRLVKTFRPKTELQKTSGVKSYYPLGNWHGLGGLSSPNLDITTSKQGAAIAYAAIYEVNAAINAIVRAAEYFNWTLTRYPNGDKEQGQELASSTDLADRHGFQAAMRKFRYENGQSFIPVIAWSYLLFGEVYVEKIREDYFSAQLLDWLNPVGVQVDYSQQINGYRYGWNQTYRTLPPEKVCYLHNRNPVNDFEGWPTVSTVIDDVNITRNLDRYLRAYFINDARPGMVISPREGNTISPQEMEIMREDTRRNNRGVDNAFGGRWFPIPVDVTIPEQADLSKTTQLDQATAQKIFEAFGVDRAMLGNMQGSEWKDDQKNKFYRNTVIPLLHTLEDYINKQVLPFFEPSGDVVLEFDTRAYDRVIESDLQQAQLADTQLKTGVITLDQAATAQDLPADEWMKNRVWNAATNTYMSRLQYDEWNNLQLDAARLRATPPTPPTPQLPLIPPTNAPPALPEIAQGEPEDEKDFVWLDGHKIKCVGWDIKNPGEYYVAAYSELKAWFEFIKNKVGQKSVLRFEPIYLRGTIADGIQSQLTTDTTLAQVKVIFADIFDKLSPHSARLKAIQATRIDFEDGILDAINAAINGKFRRSSFTIEMKRLVARAINAAYRDGLADGGVEDEPDEDEYAWIDQHILDQREFIKGLGDAIYKSETELSPEATEQKPSMWWNKSIAPAYYEGFNSAAANQMMEFVGDDGLENCATCKRLKGQRHRLKDWSRKELIPGVNTENFVCKGFRCKHILARVRAKAYGKF